MSNCYSYRFSGQPNDFRELDIGCNLSKLSKIVQDHKDRLKDIDMFFENMFTFPKNDP